MQFDEYTFLFANIIKRVKQAEIEKFIQAIEAAYQNDRTIFICGNGGSGALASHMAEDLALGMLNDNEQQRRLKVVALTDNTPYILACANDRGFDTIFVEPLKNFARVGDLVIAISGSGNSKNVLRAIEYANNNGINSFGFTGFSGGLLKKMVQAAIHIDSSNMGAVESAHLTIFHYVFDILREKYRLIGTGIV